MSFVVSSVLLPDLPAIHRLSLSVEADIATGSLLFPNGASETSVAHLVKQDEKDMRDPKSTCRHVVVRDVPEAEEREGPGPIVSYAMWNLFVGRGKEVDKEKGSEGEGCGAYYESWPPDAHHEALKALVEMGRKKREGIMGDKNYACKYVPL